jgi:integrase
MASVYATPSGTFQVRYRDPNGRQRARHFERKTDATRFARSVQTDIERGDWLDPRLTRVTFAAWADDWWSQVAHLKPKTRDDYRRTLELHVLPALGGMPIGTVDRVAMRRFVSDLTERDVGPSTINAAVKVARLVLGVALESGAIKANTAARLPVPRPPRTEKHFLTPKEVRSLAETMPVPYGTLVRFAAYTGLRAGEIGALRVGRLDLLRGTVEVAESLADVNGRLIFGPTKTYACRRVPLPAFLRDDLARHLGSRPTSASDLVFTAPHGAPLRHNLFSRRQFKPAVRAAGLPSDLRFHDLRHTFAAFCIASTADPYAVMRRMGHSSIKVTYDVYGHLFPERDEEITANLEELNRRANVESLFTQATDSGSVRHLR